MRRLFYISILIIPLLGMDSCQVQLDKPFIVFERPKNVEPIWPAQLSLYKNQTFEYYSMPQQSCWTYTEFIGTWEVLNDTLTLFRDNDVEFKYGINSNELEIIGENEETYPGWMEPVLESHEVLPEIIE